MRPIQQLIHLSVLFLFLSTISYATNYYVDKNANGSNNGTSWSNAWESFGAINWSLIQPGDVVYISGGTDSTIYYETLFIGNIQGTAANPITVIAGKYAPNPVGHSGRVIIDGGNYPAQGSRTWNIYLGHDGGLPWAVEYVIIKGLESRGALNGAELEGKGNVVVFDSLTIYHWWDLAGILARGDGYNNTFSGIDSTIVRNCTIISDVNWGEETDGIYIGGATNTIIHDNYVRMRSQDEYAHVDCLQSIYSQGFQIYNNIFISDSVYSPEGGGMPIILRSGDTGNHQPVIIYNNFLYMGGVWMNGANMGYVLNTHSGDQSLYPQSPTYIFNNTIIGNGPRLAGVALDYFGPNHKGVFLNNIVAQYGDGGSAGGGVWRASIGNGSGGAVDVDSIRNNLFWRQWADARFEGPWTNGNTTEDGFFWDYWKNTLGGTGVHADPLLVNNIGNEPDQSELRGYLKKDSPAINAGEDITYLFKFFENTYGIVLPRTDIDGNPRNLINPTIGAYEYVEKYGNLDFKNYSYILSQNYPNPFNPSTAIEYYTPQLSRIKLVVYNTIGQEIQTLVDSEKASGSYEVEFNAVNLPSGVYLYRLVAANFNETRKMVLLR